MSYQLENDENLAHGLRRIVHEQVDQALTQLTETPDGRDEAVHDARKRFKKIRAVLRLIRDEIGSDVYKPENVCYRDAGRALSDVRDSVVMVETLDDLVEYFADQLSSNAFTVVRGQLVAQHESYKKKILDQQDAMAGVVDTLHEAQGRVDGWPIERNNFSAISKGLKRVYKRGRKRMAEAYADPRPERFHEWRKRTKYLWYHTRILKPVWPDVMDELADQVHDLSDYLGDDHDLAELRRTLTNRSSLFEDEAEMEMLLGLIDRQRAELQAAARPLAERIYLEKPKKFVGRMAGYWQAWQTAQNKGQPI